MKKLLLLLSVLLVTLSVSAQKTVPGPSTGTWVLIDTTYKLGSFKEGKTEMPMYFHNSTSSKITGVQFRIFFDTAAFDSPLVTSLNTTWSQHLNYFRSGNYVTIAMTYTGNSSSFTIPNGELVKIAFSHKSAFPNLTNIDSTRFAELRCLPLLLRFKVEWTQR
jgi:hypothetical protein